MEFERLIQRPDGEEGEGVIVHNGPDLHGTYLFTNIWMSDYHPGHPDGEYRHALRAQVFRSKLPRWVRRL
jgi:hypothetical protein